MMKEQIKSVEKTKQLLLYIANKMEDNPHYGSIILNKTLYYIDHIHYLKTGNKITNFNYINQERGHTPLPSQFVPQREKMIKEGLVELIEVERFGKIQKRLKAIAKADASVFTEEELETIDKVIVDITPYTATDISNETHKELSWLLSETKEELPPFTFLLTKEDLCEDEINWATTRAYEHESMSHN